MKLELGEALDSGCLRAMAGERGVGFLPALSQSCLLREAWRMALISGGYREDVRDNRKLEDSIPKTILTSDINCKFGGGGSPNQPQVL